MVDQDPLIGQQVNNYRIMRRLGQGGMASVYLAADVALKRDVVVKVLLPALAENEQLRLRFQREAQATAQLQHPNIVQVYTTGSMPDGSPYIALQYIEGGSLSDHLLELSRTGQWISTLYALSITRQMASALQVAHQADIIHRDLKPSNILLRKDGTPVLSDLGIAAIQQATIQLTQTGGIIGTPNYMSPEQASSQIIDGRSDIYSLGVILYELLSGRLPFDAESPWGILHQHIYEQPTPLAQVRPNLTPRTISVVETCLQKKPDDRYADAAALATALEKSIADENLNPLTTIGAGQTTVVEPMPVPAAEIAREAPSVATKTEAKKVVYWPIILILAVVLLGVGGVFLWMQGRGPGGDFEPAATPITAVLVITATDAPTEANAMQPSAATEERLEAVTPQPIEETREPSLQSISAIVDATLDRNNTGITVHPGQTVSIIYDGGEWQAGPSPTWSMVGPDGDPQVPAKSTFPVPDAPIGSLIAGIGDEPPLLVGQGTTFVANAAGVLWLAANDDGYDDNFGQMQVLIELGPAPEKPPTEPISQGVVAYSCGSTGHNQIFLYDLDRGEQFLLANQPANSVVPAFSHSGAQLAFRSDETGSWQIYVSDLDGGNRRQVTTGGGNNYEANWSPDDNRLAFVSDRGGSKQIFVMNSDGSNQQQLTFNDAYNDDPSWSVMDQIAYESDEDGRFSIYQLPSQGGEPLILIDAGNSSSTPAWSPDGRRIAFESRVGDERQIWSATSDGTNLQRITGEGTSNERPAWSPDGRRIAFHSNYQQTNDSSFDIWIVDIETRNLRRITSRGDCTDPAWGQSIREQQSPELPAGACQLDVGATIAARPNTRLWDTYDVTAGQAVGSVDAGTFLLIIDGPKWGQIRRDIDVSDWWWQVERPSDGLSGWVWQARLEECAGP